MQTHSSSLADNLVHFLNANLKGIAAFVGVAAIVAGGYFTFQWYQEKQEFSAAEEFAPLEKEFFQKREDFTRAKYSAMQKKLESAKKDKKAPSKADDEVKGLATGDMAKDYGDIPQRMESFLQRHPKHKAGTMAALYLADLQNEYKQTPKAIEILENRVAHLNSSDILYAVTLMKLGNLQSAAASCDKAAVNWDKVAQIEAYKEFHAVALLRKGVCLETLQKPEEAKQAYRQVSEKFPQSARARTAQKYLLLLESQKGS